MCRKNKVYWSSIKFVTSFYRGIQCDKTCKFVHDEAFEVQHEMPILDVELKRHTKSITNIQLPLNSQYVTINVVVFGYSVNFYKLFNLKC